MLLLLPTMTRTWPRRCRLRPLRLLKTKPAPRSRRCRWRRTSWTNLACWCGMATPSPSSRRSGASGYSNQAVVDVDAVASRPPSPTPTTPPPRRRLIPSASRHQAPPLSSRAARAGIESPASLGVANDACNDVAPGTLLPGGSSDEDERGGGASCRR